MEMLIGFTCGFVGGTIASVLGYTPASCQWWIIVAPWIAISLLLNLR